MLLGKNLHISFLLNFMRQRGVGDAAPYNAF